MEDRTSTAEERRAGDPVRGTKGAEVGVTEGQDTEEEVGPGVPGARRSGLGGESSEDGGMTGETSES